MKKIFLFLLIIFSQVAVAQVVGTPYIITVDKNDKYFKSCKEILAATPSSASGTYTIDVDGPGGAAPFNCHCDMTTDGGGWTLVAIRNTNAVTFVPMFGEIAKAPVLPSVDDAGKRLSNIWSLNNASFTFNNIRFTDAGTSFTSKAIASFGSATTLSALNTTYASYSQSPTNATVTTSGIAGAALTNFYFRGKSTPDAPYLDSGDWAVFAFSTGPTLATTDLWDRDGDYWILAGIDSTYDPMTYTNVSGAILTSGVTNGRHWGTGTHSRAKITYVWLK